MKYGLKFICVLIVAVSLSSLWASGDSVQPDALSRCEQPDEGNDFGVTSFSSDDFGVRSFSSDDHDDQNNSTSNTVKRRSSDSGAGLTSTQHPRSVVIQMPRGTDSPMPEEDPWCCGLLIFINRLMNYRRIQSEGIEFQRKDE